MHRRLRHPIVLVPIAIVVTIVAVWWLAFRPDEEATASSTTTKLLVEVTTGPMSETVSAEGTVAAAQTDDLSFSASGTVTAVNVKAGDAVTTGQVLATIDSAELEPAVASAEAEVADAEATSSSDDESSGASDAQIAADETSLTSAEDQLADAEEALAGASLVATFDGTGRLGRPHRRRGARQQTAPDGTSTPPARTAARVSRPPTSGRAPTDAAGHTRASDDSDTGSTAQIQVVSTGRFTGRARGRTAPTSTASRSARTRHGHAVDVELGERPVSRRASRALEAAPADPGGAQVPGPTRAAAPRRRRRSDRGRRHQPRGRDRRRHRRRRGR